LSITSKGVIGRSNRYSPAFKRRPSRLIQTANGFTAAHGSRPLSLGYAPTLRAATGTVIYFGLLALLSFGVAMALRDTAAAATFARLLNV